MKRPAFRHTAASKKSVLAGRTRGWAEIDRILRSEDISGRLTRDELPTPALLLDLDAFEFNVDKMARYARGRKLALRPHGKTHKCPEIAHILVAAGAVGSCAAKISEAEVFAREGVRGLLVTTPAVGKYKIERAVRLAAACPDTIFCVDDPRNARDLSDAASLAHIQLNVAIDLFVGGRTGMTPGAPAVALAEYIESLQNIELVGIQAYASHAAHTVGWTERRAVAREAMGQAAATKALLQSKGIKAPLLTGGSTGTYDTDSEIEGLSELQPGSYIFMDLSYNEIGGRDGPVYADFRNSLSVLTTVISKPNKDMVVVDGGFKAFSTDQPVTPSAQHLEGARYSWGGDEHGVLEVGNSSASLKVGDHVEFIIPHCDPSVNLYDRIFCLRGDRVESAWKIAARGMSQ